ncbi:hypothetical protein BDK51DRAFT_28676 [Blyttiomyces helicus]|uniref:Uncharacterized protein n=1 Tax=Blyttiomyces helicus TaxID=388810 RepID=A0A4P9W640_9FUNG|nr:hypothetical protein BDK51DRAFT_28676 [Blyttiomyces helicus]|eukprot:RKO87764.1 hypothetical protein BDK51DRAFT_28676 [Blyttiomyces helicus]
MSAASKRFMGQVDQPVGVGYSFSHASDYATNEIGVGEDFFLFLNKFNDVFPETLAHRLTGESFGNTTIQYDIDLIGHFFEETNFSSENRTYLDQIYDVAANCSGIDPSYFGFVLFPNLTDSCFT